jgi:catechol 2,3-dioxygenase-like lactoylglutathione lyase family enzyme
MQLRGILEAVVYASDLDAAEQFYTNVLGLPAFQREPNRHVFFRFGDGVFLVFNPAVTSRQITHVAGVAVPLHGTTGAGHVAFRVRASELPGWRARLHAAGVEIESEIHWPNGGESIYFRDPAGNSIEIATPKLWGLGENR